MNNSTLWPDCVKQLESSLSEQEIKTWVQPLQCFQDNTTLQLFAPNRYVLDYVKQNLSQQIRQSVLSLGVGINAVLFEIGSHNKETLTTETPVVGNAQPKRNQTNQNQNAPLDFSHARLNAHYTFTNHVEGKSNQLARAAAMQVSSTTLGNSEFNPLFIYGGVGLGKTHLMQAVGHAILLKNPAARVAYIYSEFFVNDLVKALRNNTINKFKQYYRSLDVLLIDDIQFFAKKTHSQEEFFHTFNTLLDGKKQIIMTSDRIPKAIENVEERLRSRLASGLSVAIDPPELETRIAIIEKKALEKQIQLPNDVALFIAETVRSNVRELEGALNRVVANALFLKQQIDVTLAKEALQDLLNYQQKKISLENIQKCVAGYFKIRVADLLSQKRTRTIARPRQLAMALAKKYTTHSLPKIGDGFGGRDHTTVLHACRQIEKLIATDETVREDYENLQRIMEN